MKSYLLVALICTAVCSAKGATGGTLRFEAEKVLLNKDLLVPNRLVPGKWNLWSRDRDAAKKWSGGIVLMGPRMEKNWKPGTKENPILKFSIPLPPQGIWQLSARLNRAAMVSLDQGRNWHRITSSANVISGFVRGNGGKLEVWLASSKTGGPAGSTLLDYFTLTPAAAVKFNQGNFDGRAGSFPYGWGFWKRDPVPSKMQIAENGKSGNGVRITSLGSRDWSFHNGTRIPVEFGDKVKIGASVKSLTEKNAAVRMQLCAINGGAIISWSLGELEMTAVPGKWQDFSSEVEIPEGLEAVSIRFIGEGKSDFMIDSVVLECIPGKKDQKLDIGKPKGPVRGFAKKRVEEKLSRGVIAVTGQDKVYVSWRLLKSDPADIAFDVFRNGQKCNPSPIRQTTDFVDEKRADAENVTYEVRPCEGFSAVSGSARLVARQQSLSPYLSFKSAVSKDLPFKIGIGDLNGDGVYDYVVEYARTNVDPYYRFWKKSPCTFIIEAFDGKTQKSLWHFDRGWGIEHGIWYSPFIVYDFNGDGKAEVVLKAADGDLRDERGQVNTGEEYLLVLNGETGKEITRDKWLPRKPFVQLLGKRQAHNFSSRNQLAVAYLDGKTPAIIVLRGTYNLMYVDAWQLNGTKLEKLWNYRSAQHGARFHGQGAHSTRRADIDGDGRDEIVLGSAAVNDDGTPMWSTGKGHPDYIYVADLNPKRKGFEVAAVLETPCAKGGINMVDAKTGEMLFELPVRTWHCHDGYAGDIDPERHGVLIGGTDVGDGRYRAQDFSWLYDATGKCLQKGADTPFFELSQQFVYWDGDLRKEVLANKLRDFRGEFCGGGYEGKEQLVADVLGDWREEIFSALPGEMRIYISDIPAMDRRVTLMQDDFYRLAVATASMGYRYDALPKVLPSSVSPDLNLTLSQNSDRKLTLKTVVSASLEKGIKGKLKLLVSENIELQGTEWDVELDKGGIFKESSPVTCHGVPKGIIKAELTLEDGTVLRGQVPVSVREIIVKQKPEGFFVEAGDFTSEKNGKLVIQPRRAGAYGKSVSHWDNKGHSVTYTITVPADGQYQLRVSYATPAKDVKRTICLDDKNLGTFDILATGGFGKVETDWEIFTPGLSGTPYLYSLKQGKHKITLVNENGSMNMDYISLVPVK